ncbi:LD-carboxypeptidase [Sphingomonadaceae bacterium jetA1]|jgi:muramoyltetrapeptide carboxypeptidase|uniref:LD-carboxypeptidase n=1 Tax=Facivitalis istanbulensis TaxID=3075838 RepID=UPI00348F34B4
MKIGILAPSSIGNPAAEAPASAFAAIAYPALDLIFHPQCYEQDGHFAGSDDRRAAAFLEFANDPGVDAIWFLRGGYGSNRILSRVMPKLNGAAGHKTYIGYSDIGFVLAALYARRIGRPVHGPMVSDIRRQGGDVTIARSLGWLASGDRQGLEPGLDGRPAAAFNLSILAALIGTPWLPDLTDHVLLIEEVSEHMYAIDRMLFTMANATQLKGLAGVRLGAVSNVQDNEPAWGETLEFMIQRWCGEMGVPYLGRARIGHVQDNHLVPFGIA